MPTPSDIIDGRYRLTRLLGEGGYGSVYAAEELSENTVLGAAGGEALVLRQVALKLLNTQRAVDKRFLSEVRALCKLNHPSIVTVYGYGRETQPYVAMELVEGRSLAEWIGEPAKANINQTLRWLIGVADALSHAHARGVVHRDLKPHNVLITDDGWPKVVDFGLSWLVDPTAEQSQKVGTPGYLAPEVIEEGGQVADHRVDIYGLGATIFACFAGCSPFRSQTMVGTLKRHLSGDYTFPDDFPLALRPLVSRCLETDPIDRPRTAADVAEALRRLAVSSGRVTSSAGDDTNAHTELAEWQTLPDRVDVRDARVSEIERFDHPQRGAGLKFRLGLGDAVTGASQGAFAYAGTPESSTRRVFDVLQSAWPNAEMSLYGARTVANSRGERFISSDGSTVPVLEPYFPVSVTDVARVEGVRSGACGSRALVELREPPRFGKHLLLGSLAHDTLEAMVSGAEVRSLDAAFARAVVRLRWQALAAGLDDDALAALRSDLDLHFDTLDAWTKPIREKQQGRAAEAARYSGRYGLEGRIDLAMLDGDVLRILELKTGGFESPEHVRQLRCYLLLWDGIAEAQGMTVEGELLYSKKNKRKPIQRRGHAVERDVVLARNHVVAMHRWFSDGDTPYRPPSHGDIPSLCDDSPCRFRRDTCAKQSDLLGSMCGDPAHARAASAIDSKLWRGAEPELVRAARAYYFHWTRLIEREYRAASRDMGATFRTAGLDERVQNLDAVRDATLGALEDGQLITLTLTGGNIFHAGDEVIVHRGDVDAAPSLHAKVIAATHLSVRLRCASTALIEAAPKTGWIVDRHKPRIGFRDMHRALYGFLATSDPRRLERIVLPHMAGVRGQRGLAGVYSPPLALEATGDSPERALNEDQQRAISEALEGHDAFLIHGPPGTGKTTVIAELTARLVARGQRVLLAACTNTAVDTMLSRVVQAGVTDVLRVGSTSRATPELMDALRDAGREPERHFTVDLERSPATLAKLRQRLLDNAVVAATSNACVSSPVFAALGQALAAEGSTSTILDADAAMFDVAIIDEASQLTEPMALAAIQRARRFVLVGDDKQLPPVVRAPDALTSTLTDDATDLAADLPGDPPATPATLGGLDMSLFERLRPHVPHVLLRVQYRMNMGVQAFPNIAFYDGRLVAADANAHRELPLAVSDDWSDEMRRRLDPKKPSVWVDVESDNTGRSHPDEAAAIVETIITLIEAADGPVSIGVVSPYRSQCLTIRAALDTALGEDSNTIEVETVERFQGREKDVMMVSLVARDWSDFVMDPRRLNVTLTRARSKVIVFGNRALGQRMMEGIRASAE